MSRSLAPAALLFMGWVWHVLGWVMYLTTTRLDIAFGLFLASLILTLLYFATKD
jgi:hypothetical protein